MANKKFKSIYNDDNNIAYIVYGIRYFKSANVKLFNGYEFGVQ